LRKFNDRASSAVQFYGDAGGAKIHSGFTHSIRKVNRVGGQAVRGITMASSGKLLVGLAIVAGAMMLELPAFAADLKATNIQFMTNGIVNSSTAPNLNTWTHSGSPLFDNTGIGGVNRRVLNDFNNYGDTAKATAALSDNDRATNVELWTTNRSSTDRTIYDNVGFSATFGKHQVKVESVTKADWADGSLATAWLSGFRSNYSGLMQSINTTPNSNLLLDFDRNLSLFTSYLSTNGFNELGDANIGDISLNDQTGQLKLDLVGHLDAAGRYVDTRRTVVQGGRTVANSNYRKKSADFARNTTGNVQLDSALFAVSLKAFDTGRSFQMSEVAKVTVDGKTNYAMSFAATDSGAIAGDRNKTTDATSHTGLYTWTTTVKRKVPEPTLMLGLATVAGLAAKRQSPKRQGDRRP
jgi:hypothetical protein